MADDYNRSYSGSNRDIMPTETTPLANDNNKIRESEKSNIDQEIGILRPKSSLLAACANLALGVLGAGQLTLPFAIKCSGLVFGILLLLLLGSLSMYVLVLLTRCCKVLKLHSTEKLSYGDILERTLGHKYRNAANLFLALYAWGGGVSFMCFLEQVLLDIVTHFGHQKTLSKHQLLVISTGVVVLPLTLCRSLDRLKFTSFIGSFCALFVMVVVVYTAPWKGFRFDTCAYMSNSTLTIVNTNNFEIVGLALNNEYRYQSFSSLSLVNDTDAEERSDLNLGFGGRQKYHLWPTSFLDFVNSIPLMSFALNSAWCYTNIIASMKKSDNLYRCYTLIFSSHFVIIANYLVLAVIGYLSYCEDTLPNILSNMGTVSLLVIIAKILLVAQLCFALPMRFHVTRNVIYDQSNYLNSHYHMYSSGIKGRIANWIISSAIYGSAVMVTCLVASPAIAIGLTSAVCASFLIYIFPACSYIQLEYNRHEKEKGFNLIRDTSTEHSDNDDDVAVGPYYKRMQNFTVTVIFPVLVLLIGLFVLVGGVSGIIVKIIS